MKKLLPILFLLCSVAVFAEGNGIEDPVSKGGLLPPHFSTIYTVIITFLTFLICLLYFINPRRFNIFYILDFVYYKVAEVYGFFGLAPIGKKDYTRATPDFFVSAPIFNITLIIPLYIYKLIFCSFLDKEAFFIGMLIVLTPYCLYISIAFDRRYKRISIDRLRREYKYKFNWLYRLVPGFVVLLGSIVLSLGGMFLSLIAISEGL